MAVNRITNKQVVNKESVSRVEQISTKNPAWISEDATALLAIEKMTSLKISTLLVHKNKDVNKKTKKVVGIITMLNCLSRGIK